MRPAHAGAVITPALRLGLGVLLFLCLVGAANMLAAWLASSLRIDLNPRTEPFIHDLITWSLIGYGVLIALPFVPGIEIAVALVMVAGPGIAPVLYAATIAGLCLSFAAGRLVPLSALVWILDRVRLRRLGQLAAEMKQRDQPGRLDSAGIILGLEGRAPAAALSLSDPRDFA